MSKPVINFYIFDEFNRFLDCITLKQNEFGELLDNECCELSQKISPEKFSAIFKLIKPKIEVLDYAWNERLCTLLVERQELEHAMSWLSTLGGAFSALGDSFENCAKVAGKISIQQFKIAFQLGEPPLVARCRLYMALSLVQLGKLASAKHLIEEQYQLAKTIKDIKLQNMCKGIWAKLQYIHKQKKNHKIIMKKNLSDKNM